MKRDSTGPKRSSRYRRAASATAVLASITIVAAACSSSGSSTTSSSSGSTSTSGSSGSSKLPSVITVTSIQDLTGAVGPVGISTQDGMNLAVKAIEASHMLGSTKIQITYKDTQTTQAMAVSEASAAADSNTDAIFGPVLSTEAVAVAPIVESAKIPTIFTQAGGPGVVTPGGYVFRVTAPQSEYQPKMVAYLKSKGVKTVTMLFDATVPTGRDRADDAAAAVQDRRHNDQGLVRVVGRNKRLLFVRHQGRGGEPGRGRCRRHYHRAEPGHNRAAQCRIQRHYLRRNIFPGVHAEGGRPAGEGSRLGD
jgi:ABC-type branched-subunit amino acid transport system substrate-binding protein